ncbi:MAG: amidohydrolase, partial [Candidatus Auribacterota bacterium]|nr:amidohydrolase [Candidatus Auribacterota bacterium]
MTKEKEILIRHGIIVTVDDGDTIYEDGALLIRDDRIADIGEDRELADKYPSAQVVIDASRKAVIPGLINTHLHSGLIRGTAEDLPLFEWLMKHVDPMHKALRAEEAYAAARLCYAEGLKSGTTCMMDMYRYMHRCADAAEELGNRVVLAPYVADKPGYDYFETMESNERLIRERNNTASGRIKVWVGLEHLVYCTEDAFKEAVRLADKYDTGIHTHGEESFEMALRITRHYGRSPIRVFLDYGILGPGTVLAHCVQVTPEEIDIIARTGTGVAHCPCSNMKLASGVAPIPAFLERGVNVGLGTDGVKENNNLDMFEEMKFASLMQKLHHLDATSMDANTTFRMATIGGAKVLGLDEEIGSLEVGKKADLVLVNLGALHTTPIMGGKYSNVVAHLVFAAGGADVERVYVNGRPVVVDGELVTASEEEIISRAKADADRL